MKSKKFMTLLTSTLFISTILFNGQQVKAVGSESLTYTSEKGWWATNSGYDTSKVTDRTVSGDFDGDGKTDIATMYDYGNGGSRIHVFKSTGGSFSYDNANGWWNSTGYTASRVTGRMVVGDYNGDGKDDIATMYDYGNQESRMHVFLSTGSSFTYDNANGWWSAKGYDANKVTGRMVAGDFNGDGKDDVAAMYDYGNGESRIHVFKSTGKSFNYDDSNGWWNSKGFTATSVTDRIVAGDFNGDGVDDIATMYDYGSGGSKMHVFTSTKSKFTYNYGWWSSTGYTASKVTGRMVAGDFNGDGKDDVATMYDYGNEESRIHVFKSTGSSYNYDNANGWWGAKGYNANKVTGRMVSGNFDGKGSDDISTFFNYGNGSSRLHMFLSNANINQNFIQPVNGIVTSEYGTRIHPITGQSNFHSGIDISAVSGTAIKASASGKVIIAGFDTSYGNYVMIDHGQGIVTLYAHASALNVKNGQIVTQGQVISYVGSTGMSTGPHLHFEVRINGVTTNPRNYVKIV